MSKPSLLERLFRRKPAEELNPFTGEVKVYHVKPEDLEIKANLMQEDRLDKWGGSIIRTIGIIVTMYNFLMFLGYVAGLDIFFAILFAFSTYFSIVYVKRSNRDRLERVGR